VQRIALAALQPAAAHAVIVFGVANRRFDGLPSLQPTPLLFGHRLVSPSMDDADGHQVINAAVAKVHHGRRGIHANVLQQRCGLGRTGVLSREFIFWKVLLPSGTETGMRSVQLHQKSPFPRAFTAA
jgi:hypothetical protein